MTEEKANLTDLIRAQVATDVIPFVLANAHLLGEWTKEAASDALQVLISQGEDAAQQHLIDEIKTMGEANAALRDEEEGLRKDKETVANRLAFLKGLLQRLGGIALTVGFAVL